MRIGIITIHNSPNYGASLQAFALWKYITDCGHECEIIDLHRPHQADYIPSKRYVPYRQQKKSVFQFIKTMIRNRKESKKNSKKYLSDKAQDRFDKFNSKIRYSRPYYGIDMLYANPPVYDVYITGSDQLWNPSQFYCLEPYFLTFAPIGKKRISYAPSIGIPNINAKEKEDFSKWLKYYDSISVRELQAKQLLETIVDEKIECVADPTFLLERNYWKSIASPSKERCPYILLFTLSYDVTLLEYAKSLSKQSGIKLIYLTAIQPSVDNIEYEPVTDAGPIEWLGYIRNAEMVITNSFHGTVFSIILEAKQFVTYISPSNNRGSRIVDLLHTFDLSDHLLHNLTSSYGELLNIPYSLSSTRKIYDEIQMNGRDFLKRNL